MKRTMHFGLRAAAPLFIVTLLAGCTKEAGEGGKAQITGTVLRQDVNAAGAAIGDPYPYLDTRVYIAYGDNDTYDDDIRTGPDGKYSFRWLRKGDYTVYTFGEQCDCSNDMVVLSRSVSIDGKKDVVIVPTLIADNY